MVLSWISGSDADVVSCQNCFAWVMDCSLFFLLGEICMFFENIFDSWFQRGSKLGNAKEK